MWWLTRTILLLAFLGTLALSSGASRASAVPPAVNASSAEAVGVVAPAPILLPIATTPTPTCDANADPQTCADAFVQPFNRVYQVAVLILLSIIGGGCLILGLIGIARGVGGGLFNEPRWVSRALMGIGGAVILFVFAVILVTVFGNIKGLVPTPSLPQLGG